MIGSVGNINGLQRLTIALVFLSALWSGSAFSLTFTGVGLPDIKADNLDVTYTAATDLLRVTGHVDNSIPFFPVLAGGATTYRDSGGTAYDMYFGLNLNAEFDFAVELAQDGTIDAAVNDGLGSNLLIVGNIPGVQDDGVNGGTNYTLLTANVTEFGEDGADLQFKLEITGGELADEFGNVGSIIGYKLLGGNGNRTADYSVIGDDVADLFLNNGAEADVFKEEVVNFVPLPGSALLIGMGLLVASMRRRRKIFN